jgi:hypothetical protein
MKEAVIKAHVVRWLDNDHEALAFPGPEARVEPPAAPSR